MIRHKYAQILADASLESFTLMAAEMASDQRSLGQLDRTLCRPPHRKLAILVPMAAGGAAFPLGRISQSGDYDADELAKVITIVMPLWGPELPHDGIIRAGFTALVSEALGTEDCWPPDLEAWTEDDIPPAWLRDHQAEESMAAWRQEQAERLSSARTDDPSASVERIRSRLGDVIATVDTRQFGATVLLHVTLGELIATILSPSDLARLRVDLNVPADATRETAMRRIGREAISQAETQRAFDGLDGALADAGRAEMLSEARAFQELRPDIDPDLPPATPDQLAADLLLSETQVEARDLALSDQARSDPRPFDESLAETASVLERNARIFRRRDDGEGGLPF